MNTKSSQVPNDGAWTMEQLREAESASQPLEFLFFWGHTPKVDDEVGDHVFSQWWVSPFLVDGVEYLSAEHFMMAEKARLFGDADALNQILSAETPAEAKALGRAVRDFDQETWVEHRMEIVTRGSLAKFESSDVLRNHLVGTGHRVLVEASPRDRIWGIGLGRNSDRATRPSEWRGRNLLGFALMRARASLAGSS